MENEELLKKLGLDDNQTKIYLALIGNESMTVSGIAKVSGLHRPAVYKAIPKLELEGLITSVPHGKQRRYVAESPQKLKILVENLNNLLLTTLPDLEDSYESKGYKPTIRFFKGRSGISHVFSDLVTSLGKGETYYRYTSNKDLDKTEKYLPKNYRKIRDQKQLQRYIINNAESAKGRKPNLNRDVKIMSSEFDLFDYDVSMLIYGDKIAFLDFNTETATVIENKNIAAFQRSLFKFIYDKLDSPSSLI